MWTAVEICDRIKEFELRVVNRGKVASPGCLGSSQSCSVLEIGCSFPPGVR